MNRRAIIAEDLVIVHDHFAKQPKKIIEVDNEECAPMVFGIQLKQDEPVMSKPLAVPPAIASSFMRSDDAKDIMMDFIGMLLTDTFQMDVVVHVSEGWMKMKPNPDYEYGDITADPKRKEVLLLALHTRDKTYNVVHVITTTESARTVALTPIDLNMNSRGRLCLNPEQTTNSAMKGPTGPRCPRKSKSCSKESTAKTRSPAAPMHQFPTCSSLAS